MRVESGIQRTTEKRRGVFQGSEPRGHSGEYVCMLSQVCPGVSKSTEDIRVRTTVWILQLIDRDQF